MGIGNGKPDILNVHRWIAAPLAASLLLLAGCEGMGTSAPAKTPYRPVAIGKSSITGTSGEVGVYLPVVVTLKDSSGYGISKVIPVITATNGAGSSSGVSSGGCGVTNSSGVASCTIKANTADTYTLRVVSPSAISGGTFTTTQYARSLSFSTQPSCGGTCTARTDFATQPVVTVLDKVGTAMVLPAASYNVVLTITSPGSASFDSPASVASLTVAASIAGVATFAGVDIDIAGTYTLTATATDGVTGGSITAASSSVTVGPGVATKLAVTTDPSSSSAANTAFSTQPIVKVQDASGNTVTSNSSCVVTMSLGGGGATDTLLGTISKTAVSGVIDFASKGLRVATTAGGTTYTLTATGQNGCSALTTATSSTFTVTLAGTPYQVAVVTPPSAAALNQVWGSQPVVQVLDIDGAVVTTDNETMVTVSKNVATTATGVITGTSSVRVQNGVATFSGLKTTGTAGADAGQFTLDVRATNPNVDLSGVSGGALVAGELYSTTTSQTITAAGITPARLRFMDVPGSTSAVKGAVLSTFRVEVLDSSGYPCVNDNSTQVTLTLPSKPSGASFSSAGATYTNVTATGGVISFPSVKLDTTGIYQMLASSGALTAAYSASFTVSDYGTAKQLVFSTQPAAGASVPPTAWATQPVVQVKDVNGNLVANDSSTVVSLGCLYPTSGCTLNGTTSMTAVNGVATFLDVRTAEAGLDNVTIQASANGLVAAGSNSFNVPSDPNAVEGVLLGMAQEPLANGAVPPANWNQQPIVNVLDVDGQIVTIDSTTRVSVTCTYADDCAATPVQKTCSLLGTTTVIASSGVATFTNLRTPNALCSITLRFTATNMLSVSSQSFDAP